MPGDVQIFKLAHRAGKRNTSKRAIMNPYYNLPPEQRAAQRLVDQYNSDAQLWKTVEPKRRKLYASASPRNFEKAGLAGIRTRPASAGIDWASDSMGRVAKAELEVFTGWDG